MHTINKPEYSHQFPFFIEISTYINNLIQQIVAKSSEGNQSEVSKFVTGTSN